jgi:hypothetical protein
MHNPAHYKYNVTSLATQAIIIIVVIVIITIFIIIIIIIIIIRSVKFVFRAIPVSLL